MISKSICRFSHKKRGNYRPGIALAVPLFAMAVTLVFDPDSSSSQNHLATLGGKVVDASNGETLPGANVILIPGRRGATTDRDGRFTITHIAPGPYQLIISFVGFAAYQDSLLLAAAEARYLHIALKPQPLALAEITVSAGRERLMREVNLGRDFIAGQEIRTTSSLAEPDLFRSLAYLPGVAQANDFNSRFYVRGGQSNENHVLVEGMTIHNPYHALGFFSTFDVDAIKAVEVYRGIFPARYGERLSSVTNVILRDGNAQRFSGLGMVSLATTKFLLEGPLLKYRPASGRKWTFMLDGRRTYVDQILKYPLYFYDFSLKSVYDGGRKTRITWHGFYGFDRLKGAEDPFPFPSTDYADIRWNNYAFGVLWQQFLAPGNVWATHLSYTAFHSLAQNPQSFYMTEFRQDNHIRELNLDSEWQRWLWNKWQLTLGYEWSRYHVDQYLDRFINNFLRQFFQGRWRATNQHKVYAEIAGGKGEHWIYEAGLTGLNFSSNRNLALAPRLGAKYLLNNAWRVKAGFGRHYQFLTTLEDDDDPVILFDAWLPTPSDRPIARADHYGLGVEVSPSSSVEAEAELYYRRSDHLTRYNRTQLAGERFYLNGWGESYGLELRANYNLKNYYGFANYSLGWATSHFFLRNQPMRFVNDFRWQTFPANGDVRHILNAMLGLRSGGWDISVTLVYQSGRPYTAVLGSTYNLVDLPYVWDFFPTFLDRREGFFFGGAPAFIYSSKNSFRYPFYQRVDFRAARNFSWLGIDWTFFAQIYNIFFRKNAAFQFPNFDYFPLESDYPSGLPIVPTFGLTFRF